MDEFIEAVNTTLDHEMYHVLSNRAKVGESGALSFQEAGNWSRGWYDSQTVEEIRIFKQSFIESGAWARRSC